MLTTLYSTGMRRAELCRLKVEDIDGGRMIIHIRQGKGGKDRDVPLDPKLRETLREYYRWMRPKTYLFPGTENGWRADKPITAKVLWEACREAAQRAGITKRVSPHLLRHSFATHLVENGADLPTVQALLGHADLRATSIYLHLSQRHLKAAGTPLDKIEMSSLDKVKRSRKLHPKRPPADQRMKRPPFEVKPISIRAVGKSFIDKNRSWLNGLHLKVLSAIERCRTAALGGHRDRCIRCGYQTTSYSYNSCRNRHCGKCQTNARDKWLAAQLQELLPVAYVHVVFTLPHQLAPLVFRNKRILYDLLFKASAATPYWRSLPIHSISVRRSVS